MRRIFTVIGWRYRALYAHYRDFRLKNHQQTNRMHGRV